nr:MAG: hypothetical protein AM325_01575 [Candidatus Thorarchaeota archaeon SMTZ1-45]
MSYRPTITVNSLIGRALVLQVLSAILTIGSLIVFVGGLSIDIEWLVIMGTLYVLGFIQMLVTRVVMQRVDDSISASLVVAILALLFSLIVGFFWILQPSFELLGIYYIIVGMINAILLTLLLEVRRIK